MRFPTAEDIVENVKMRLGLFQKLKQNGELSKSEWGDLIYYSHHHEERTEMVARVLTEYFVNGNQDVDISEPRDGGVWLYHVYLSKNLTCELCEQGFAPQRRALQEYGNNFDPYEIIDTITGLRTKLDEFKATRSADKHRLIENIAVDEAFELTGSALFEGDKQRPY